MREFTISVSDALELKINGKPYDGRPIFAGYDSENEATRLTITLGSEFDNAYLKFKTGGIEYTSAAYTDAEIEYDIPDDYMNPDHLKFWIELQNGDAVMKAPPIIFRIYK